MHTHWYSLKGHKMYLQHSVWFYVPLQHNTTHIYNLKSNYNRFNNNLFFILLLPFIYYCLCEDQFDTKQKLNGNPSFVLHSQTSQEL